MKNSQFLTEILEAAKKVGDKTKPPVTAERFLVALMDKCSAANTQQECEEMYLNAQDVPLELFSRKEENTPM